MDIIIPTCKTADQVAPLVREVEATAGLPVNVIATCQPESAARNRNLGLDLATSELRIMMDDDITGLPDGWAAALAQVLKDHPNCMMVSPQLLNPDGGFATYMMGCTSPKAKGLSIVTGPHLLTACIAIRKDELRFDENFKFSGWEDNDYSEQQNTEYPHGIRMIQHDVQVIHLNEMKGQREAWAYNKAYFHQKWGIR